MKPTTKKWLWAVIVALMVLDVATGTFRIPVIIVSDNIWIKLLMFGLLLTPSAICVLIAISKRYQLMWIAGIPSVIAIVFWGTAFGLRLSDSEHSTMMLILAILNLALAYAIIAAVYLCVFISKTIKKSKDKKKEEYS